MLSHFIKDHIYKLELRAAQALPNTLNCLIVTKVATPSIAATAGVRIEDVLVSVNGEAAATVTFNAFSREMKKATYLFYRPSSQETLELETFPGPIGIASERSTETLMANLDFEAHNVELLDKIWERGDWENLLNGSSRLLTPPLKTRVLVTLFRDLNKPKVNLENSPALLLKGAALYELGEQERGMKLIKKYQQDYEANWTTQYHAIVRYYLALEDLERGNRGRAIKCLHASYGYFENEHAAQKLADLTGQRPVKHKTWEGGYFSLDYTLPKLHGKESVTLSHRLETLQAHQLLAVTSLASYRANGPYNDLMATYSRLVTTFSQYLVGMHVITMQPETSHDVWLENERKVINKLLPLDILFDPDGETTFSLRAMTSPFTLFVSNFGGVILEWEAGENDETQWWEALNVIEELARKQMETSSGEAREAVLN